MSVLIGRRVGRLVVLDAFTLKRERYVNVRCDCGTEKVVRYENMRTRRVLSCGCKRRERGQQRGPALIVEVNQRRKEAAP